jgi:phosphopantetheine adenylyltransferase
MIGALRVVEERGQDGFAHLAVVVVDVGQEVEPGELFQ